jgi:endoglucanase
MFSTGQTVVISVGLVMAAALGFTTAAALRHDASGPSATPPGPNAPAPAAGTTSPASTGKPAPSGPASDPATTTPAGDGDAPCAAQVVIQDRWPDGFKAEVRVTNTSRSTVKDWAVGFTMPDGAKLAGGWNATMDQDGSAVTAEAPDWAPDLGPGKKAVFGFTASGTPDPLPGRVTLGTARCF